MEGFVEQVVKRKNGVKQFIIKVISVVLLITIPTVCVLIAPIIKLAYMVYIGLFLFIGGIYIVWYVFSSQKVDYEYSVNGDELHVAKIIALRKRKTVCKVPIRDIELLGRGEKTVDGVRILKSYIAARDYSADSENYYAVYTSIAHGKTLLVFTPNETILEGMKTYLNKDIVLKLFYNRNAG